MQAALALIARAPGRLLTHSASVDPATLLAEAKQHDPAVTLDELAGARLCASEFGNGSPAELACIVDTARAQAQKLGQTLIRHAIGGKPGAEFGPQGGERPASTRLSPTMRHLAAARAVLSGELSGIARGAVRFFSPKSQDRSNRAYVAGEIKTKHTCTALGILRAWSFDLPPCHRGSRCCDDGLPPAAKPGPFLLGWVGPIAGVDARRLLLLRPMAPGADHQAAYEAARVTIETEGPTNV